jgi:hypothetical protein
MVWLGASKKGLTSPIIFKPGETLSHENYIEAVLPHAQSEGQQLLGDDFIYQQDNACIHIRERKRTEPNSNHILKKACQTESN